MNIAPALKSLVREVPLVAPITSTPQMRTPEILDAVADQFGVEENPRYLPGDGFTYCNYFTVDFMAAMNAILPHWRFPASGNPARPEDSTRGAREMLVNDLADWLDQHGGRYFWTEATAAEAQAWANTGKPALAIWKNAGGHGHVAPVRPGDVGPVTLDGPLVANAGTSNHNRVRVSRVFVSAWRVKKVRFWCAP